MKNGICGYTLVLKYKARFMYISKLCKQETTRNVHLIHLTSSTHMLMIPYCHNKMLFLNFKNIAKSECHILMFSPIFHASRKKKTYLLSVPATFNSLLRSSFSSYHIENTLYCSKEYFLILNYCLKRTFIVYALCHKKKSPAIQHCYKSNIT